VNFLGQYIALIKRAELNIHSTDGEQQMKISVAEPETYPVLPLCNSTLKISK